MDTSTRTRDPRMTETRTQAVLRSLSRASAWVVAGSGALALAGWAFDMPVAKSVFPGLVPMNPATAICFLLLGLGLRLAHVPFQASARQGRQWCGALVLGIGGVRLLAYASGRDYGLDSLFFPNRLTDEFGLSNRMAPNTAALMLFSALSLMLLEVEGRRGIRPAQLPALITGFFSLLAALGYAYGALELYGVGINIPMALNSALTFCVLAVALLAARPATGFMRMLTSDTPGGVTARRLLPAALIVPVLLGVVRLWGERAGLIQPQLGVPLLVVGNTVVFAGLVWLNARLLHQSDVARARTDRRLLVQYTVTRALAESQNLKEAIPRILQAVCETLGWAVGGMWSVDTRSNSINCLEVWHAPGTDVDEFESVTRSATFPPGMGLPGRVWSSGQPLWIRDVAADAHFPRAPYAAKAGLHAALGFPIRRGTEVLGTMEFFSSNIEPPDQALLQMLGAIGSQIGQFIERLRVEKALRDSEALYHSLVETLPVNILRKDLKGRVSFGNKLYCETVGKPLAALLGKTDFDLFPVPLAEKYSSDDRRVIESRQVFDDIEEHQKADGTKLYVHVMKGPLFDARGEVVGTQTIFWDETARKEAEVQLARAAAELARSNRELEQFAYVASHDLQEPLRMVASYTQLLARRYQGQLDGTANEFIHFAVDGAIRMQHLINDLLTYSRVGTRGKPFEPTDCGQVLAETLANLKIAIEESGARVEHGPLPTVQGDRVQLVQLLQNLIGNAVKFRGTSAPGVYVSAERCGDEWQFRVRDNGIGIEPQYFERIFVIFQRLHTREEYPGTGIGLALCKKIVERHGGRIWVESQPGRGATFHFTIPAREPMNAEEPPSGEFPGSSAGASSPRSSASLIRSPTA
jgi:PAS domain S-box-containing protein